MNDDDDDDEKTMNNAVLLFASSREHCWRRRSALEVTGWLPGLHTLSFGGGGGSPFRRIQLGLWQLAQVR